MREAVSPYAGNEMTSRTGSVAKEDLLRPDGGRSVLKDVPDSDQSTIFLDKSILTRKNMNHHQIDIFRTLGPMMLPRLIDANRLDSIDDYGDYALLTYTLEKPVPIAAALDDMEDNMELNVLYHIATFAGTRRGEHCCAYSVPTSGRMYKLNAQTGEDKTIGTLYVYIFDSLEVMLEALKDDLAQHLRGGVVISKMTTSRLVSDFM